MIENSNQNQIKQEVEIIEQANNATLEKIAFYFLSPVFIPLALASTAFVCLSSVLRFVFVDLFREAFRDDLDLEGIANLYRVFVLILRTCKHLIYAPFYLLGQILALPALVFAWIKSAFVGFVRLADFVCSAGKDEKIIVASNRLDEIELAKANEDVSSYYNTLVKRYDGINVKSGNKAILGYAFGIYDFDVNRSSSSEPDTPKLEAKFLGLEGFRAPGRKWM